MQLIAEKIFEKINFVASPLPRGEYELCTFKSCDFSGADLSDMKFIECEFTECNLSNAKIAGTIFRDVRFNSCKMLGLQLNTSNGFGFSVYFDNCNLQHASFYQRKMKGVVCKNSKLAEADFTACDITGGVFANCDFMNARFGGTNLEKADFRTSFNYSINTEINKIKKARFDLPAVTGLLDHLGIEVST